MQPSDHIQKTVQETTKDDAANAPETGRRWSSGLVVALLVFVVAYAVLATTFGHWGLVLGWLPASTIAAALGWIGYCFPWIGEAIAILWDLLSLLSVFA